MSEETLTAAQARVIGALVEKSITTPQYYPLTVNAIMQATNQKSSRNPVMSLTQAEVGAALNDLEAMGLAEREEGGRATRWRQRFKNHYLLNVETMTVLLATLLRGPQTLAEMRGHAANLGGPGTQEGVQEAVDKLMDRGSPLIMMLPKGAGQKENRYLHLLSGEPDLSQFEVAASTARKAVVSSGLEERIEQLENEVASLRQRLDDLTG